MTPIDDSEGPSGAATATALAVVVGGRCGERAVVVGETAGVAAVVVGPLYPVSLCPTCPRQPTVLSPPLYDWMGHTPRPRASVTPDPGMHHLSLPCRSCGEGTGRRWMVLRACPQEPPLEPAALGATAMGLG